MAPTDEDDFAALFEASESAAAQQPALRPGDVVRGRVVGVGATMAFVGLGGGREGSIDVGEFRDPDTGAIALAEGDEIEATVVDDGATSVSIVLKRVGGRGGHLPGELEQAFAYGIPVEGLVAGENKGGFDVQLGAVRAFCPASQIDRRRGEPSQYVGERLQFRITKIEGGGRNVVVSRRQLLDEEAAAQGALTWAGLREGAIVTGTVTSVRDFGAFVDIGGIDGLIHVSEISYARVADPATVLRVGQKVAAQVVKLEPGTAEKPGRVGLSLRALEADPWTTVGDRFPVGTTVTGTVRRVEQFGAFVELAPGLDGLVHVSKLVLDRRISHPRQVVSVGEAVAVTIVSIDAAQRRIALSMVEQAKQAQDAADAEVRRDTEAHLQQAGEQTSLGTLGELLAKSRPKR
jgi:small subunit ribosomal protein S1